MTAPVWSGPPAAGSSVPAPGDVMPWPTGSSRHFLIVRRTKSWVTLTDRSRRDMEAAGLGPVVVAPHGAEPPTSALPPSACTTVVYAGFISPAKGLDILAEAWEAVGPD